ncbi:hypothetical protein Tco_1242493, partial [Tanacetum coccineum]
MITTNSRIKGKKPSRLMLPLQLKIVGITQDLALSSVRLVT